MDASAHSLLTVRHRSGGDAEIDGRLPARLLLPVGMPTEVPADVVEGDGRVDLLPRRDEVPHVTEGPVVDT